MRRAERGLTLLEVLGAVALLGILYTVLAGSTIEGLRSEGESRRRLEASLLADERLAAIELSLDAGSVPPPGSSTEEEDGFTVRTEVSAFEPPPAREPTRSASGKPRSLAARRADAGSEEAPSLFEKPASPTTPPALRTIEVTVRWEEGSEEREVRRTTYALDPAAAEELFASLGGVGPEQRAASDGSDAAGSRGRKPGDPEPTLPLLDFPGMRGGGEDE
jgi:type II secretory pathway pseudopilin PulG